MGYRIREIHLDENEVEKELERIEVHPVGVSIMKNKGKIRFLKIENVDVRAANILKQEMLSIGGEVALSRDAFYLGKNECRAIVMGTVHHFNKLIPKLKLQPFGLKDIAEEMEKIVHRTPIKTTRIGDTLFEWGKRTYIMGIINLTPYSFSGDGLYSRERFVDNALGYACLLREWGADIIDIGG
ncbi:MAG TPA: dihydropteroate synthase, partial [Firmicutes bacterium]|nr:dihydropteroate synthase [Bacillota bacterium]